MNDFLRSDTFTGTYDDFLDAITPASNGVGSGSGTFGVAIQGYGGAVGETLAGDPVGGIMQALKTSISLIGRGRKEADEITAVETPLWHLLEQINTEMGAANITVERLVTLRQIVVAAGGQYQQVLARPWKDGRAAAQGTQTMFGQPGYLRVTVENIDKLLAARGAGPLSTSTSAAAGGSSSGALLAGAAALAYAIFG